MDDTLYAVTLDPVYHAKRVHFLRLVIEKFLAAL